MLRIPCKISSLISGEKVKQSQKNVSRRNLHDQERLSAGDRERAWGGLPEQKVVFHVERVLGPLRHLSPTRQPAFHTCHIQQNIFQSESSEAWTILSNTLEARKPDGPRFPLMVLFPQCKVPHFVRNSKKGPWERERERELPVWSATLPFPTHCGALNYASFLGTMKTPKPPQPPK